MGANDNYSSGFVRAWDAFCLSAAGKLLPINYVSFDEETGTGDVGYDADVGGHAVRLRDGDIVRQLALSYDMESLKDDPTNFN